MATALAARILHSFWFLWLTATYDYQRFWISLCAAIREATIEMRRVLQATAFAVFSALWGSVALAGDVVRVDWTFVETEISPRQESHASRVSTLFAIDGRRITDSNGTTATLGQRHHGTSIYDVGYSVRYAASGGHLMKTVHTVGTNFRVDVAFLPEGGCRATVDYFRTSGRSYFETRRASDHSRMIESDQHAEDLVCIVSVQ